MPAGRTHGVGKAHSRRGRARGHYGGAREWGCLPSDPEMSSSAYGESGGGSAGAWGDMRHRDRGKGRESNRPAPEVSSAPRAGTVWI